MKLKMFLICSARWPKSELPGHWAFEAGSDFTHVTACRIALPPGGGLHHEASGRPDTSWPTFRKKWHAVRTTAERCLQLEAEEPC